MAEPPRKSQTDCKLGVSPPNRAAGVVKCPFVEFRGGGLAYIAPLDNLRQSWLEYTRKISKEFEEANNFWVGLERVGVKLLNKGRRVVEGKGKKRMEVKVSSWEPLQGETLAILVSYPPPLAFISRLTSMFRNDAPLEGPQLQVSFRGMNYPIFPTTSDPGTWRTLLPTTPIDKPGPCELNVKVDGSHHENFSGVLVLQPKEYPVESIWLSATKSKIRGTQEEFDAVKALTSTVSSLQYWSGPFTVPSEGVITTEYGLQRYYNGTFAHGYYHRGVDYGADQGDPVRAPSNGRVVLVGREADGFEIHGNCVGVDHGHGVTSILMHLSSTFVKEGDCVQTGQVVGLVGESGIATGPHLHWGLYVHGEAVDPSPWMRHQPWL